MKKANVAILLIALVTTGMVHPIRGQPTPAPGPSATQSFVLPVATQVVAPAPVILSSGEIATAPVVQTVATPTLVTVPASSPDTATATETPTGSTPDAVASTPATAPAEAPSSPTVVLPTPGTPASTPTTAPAEALTSESPTPAAIVLPSTDSTAPAPGETTTPAEAPSTTPDIPGAVVTPTTPGTELAPAPAVAPSSSGNYNVTVQASNATGTLNTEQSTQLAGEVQNLLASNGIVTGVDVIGQSVDSAGATGRRLQQTTITLDIDLVIGPLSPTQAAQVKVLLSGLQLDLGGVVVIVVIIFVPVPVFIPAPPEINIPPNVPALPTNINITVINSVTVVAGSGGTLPSQNVPGGGTVTSPGLVNNVSNVVNNNVNTVNNVDNSVNTVNNVDNSVVNTNNQVTNIVDNSVTNTNSGNSVVNNIVTNVQNPATPGSATTPTTPTSPTPSGTTTPGTSAPPAATTPSTPGGASASTAVTVATNLTYVTQAAPPRASPPAVPSPPPSPPPSCGSQPQCRIYTRDMLCCREEGILTPFQGAQVEILCTHPVRFAITCLATSGPTNISAASVYNNDYGYNYNFRTNIQWLGQVSGYLGKVVVDVQPARLDAGRQECSLNLQTPCVQDGAIVTTMPKVQPLTFNVIDFTSFYQNYVGFPPTNAIGQFSYSWMNSTYPGGCLEQPTLTVPGSFFQGAWPQMQGFAYPCNASATFGALKQTCPTGLVQSKSGVKGIQPV